MLLPRGSLWRPPSPSQVLKKICWYAVLAPSYSTDEGSSSDVATLVATTAGYKQLGDLPLHQQLLTTFTNPEIVRWGLFEAQYGPEITAEVRQHSGVGGGPGQQAAVCRLCVVFGSALSHPGSTP